MITDVYLTYEDPKDVELIKNEFKDSDIQFHFLDALSKKDGKKAFSLKGHWSARMNPFAICLKGERAVKAFYSETGEDIITNLINYLKNESC